jgi:plasmid maintenance system antidote protein VapI/DNA-binding NarL/FixJ family response regulator
MKLDNLKLLIINSHFGSRSTLRDVFKSFLHKVTINYAQNFKEAQKALSEGEIDIGFVAVDMGMEQIREFINSLKGESMKAPPPFVATLRSRGEGTTSDITNLYLEGLSGFISEPYSSNDILKLLTTIMDSKIKIEQKEKLKKASNLLLTEAARKIDSAAEHQAKNEEDQARLSMKSLKTISKSLETMYGQDSEQYSKALVDTFENIAPPAVSIDKSARNKKSVSKEIIHPGKVIVELMGQRGLTFDSLKHLIKFDATEFQNILDGKASLDETSSREISRIFGKTSREWLKMQKDYDTHEEEIKKQKEKKSSS